MLALFMVHVGVPLDAVEWWVGDIEGAGETSHVVTLPPDVDPVAPGRFLAEMLTSGEIDAMWSPPRPRLFHPSHGPLVRLFADYRAADMAYFAATRVFPPLHLVVLRRAVWENSPWVARALTKRVRSKQRRFRGIAARLPLLRDAMAGNRTGRGDGTDGC